jgi:DNA polymerase (family 10)
MKNREVAHLLSEIADYLELRDVEYKPRAYREAARNVESLSEDVEDVYERGELEEIDGVGESIASKIAEYLETGELEYYEELRANLPVDMEALTSVEGVGPKTARTLYRELGVSTLEELERAAEAGRIAEVEGFGETSQQNILEHVALAREGQERTLLGRAVPIARALAEELDRIEQFDRVDVVGSFRRRRPTVGDLDVLATAPDPAAAMEAFCSRDAVEEVLARGETKASIRETGGLQVDLRIVEPSSYGAALVYFTGSKEHNIALRNRAIDRGWKLNEYGLYDADGESVAGQTEREVYDALDLAYVPPELREDTGEVEAAADGDLPDLVSLEDVRGDLQVHTTASDGSASIAEMAAAAAERGLDYVLISEHGPGAQFAGGLDEDAFEAKAEEIAAVNNDADVAVLHGIEAEITANGLDVSDAWLDACDLVVAGLHERPDDPTDRVVTVLESAPVDVLAHPRGRLINEREPLDLDLDRIVETAAAEHVALEINGQPERLDLDWESVKRYRDDAPFVVSSDAHGTGELDCLEYAVWQARRGWLDAERVLNTLSVSELREAFA